MKTGLVIATASLTLILTSNEGRAGPCTDQISRLRKIVDSSDAGSGPTMRTGSTTGATTGSTQPQAGGSQAAVSATPRQVPRAGEVPDTNATTAMNTVTQDKATSSQDVRSQIQGQATSSQVASGAMPSPDQARRVEAALARAQSADQSADASGCTSAVNEAKGLLGVQ
jgi:hypothetical protein